MDPFGPQRNDRPFTRRHDRIVTVEAHPKRRIGPLRVLKLEIRPGDKEELQLKGKEQEVRQVLLSILSEVQAFSESPIIQ